MFFGKAVIITAKVPHIAIRKCDSDKFFFENFAELKFFKFLFRFFFLSLGGIERHSTIVYILLHLTGQILRKIRNKIDSRKLGCRRLRQKCLHTRLNDS